MDILDKLRKEIRKGITEESQVSYLLSEIRKYIDGTDPSSESQYPNLYFYCDWILHPKMDRRPTKEVLRRFESYFDKTQTIKENAKLLIKHESDFYLLNSLKTELRAFFTNKNLPLRLFTSQNWSIFKKLLIEILIDCPLENKNGLIYKFSFEKEQDEQVRFRIHIKGNGSFKTTLKRKYKQIEKN